MRFVNLTSRIVYTKFGSINPGAVSRDGGPRTDFLEKAIAEVLHICGDKLGIRLNEREAELLGKLMDLDTKGGGFKPESIPAEIRNDPMGVKRAAEAARKAQQASLDANAKANAAAARREAEINGETDPNYRPPVGPATMKGEEVTSKTLRSGFDEIMEENARIAAEKKEKAQEPATSKEMLDPIGTHMKGVAPEPEKHDAEAIGKDADPIEVAHNRSDDGTRTADANLPKTQAPERGSAMDRQAAKIAEFVGTLGPVGNAGDLPTEVDLAPASTAAAKAKAKKAAAKKAEKKPAKKAE